MKLYAHTNNNDYYGPEATFVLEPPTKEVLHQMFTMHANQIMMMGGLSIRSKHDQFVKSTGRTMAEKRLAPRIVEFDGISVHGTKHVYQMRMNHPVGHKNYVIHFHLTTVAESDQVKLIRCQVYDA